MRGRKQSIEKFISPEENSFSTSLDWVLGIGPSTSFFTNKNSLELSFERAIDHLPQRTFEQTYRQTRKIVSLLGLQLEQKIETSIHVRKHGNCLEIVKLIVYDQKYFMFDSSRDIKETVMDFTITTKSLFFATFFSKLIFFASL